MTVGNWKKLLTLLNLAAVLAMAGTAYGFYSHSEYLADKTWEAPSFQPDPRPAEEIYADTSHTGISLGAPIEPVKADPTTGEMAKPKEKKLVGLAKLGEILNAVAVSPPYDYVYPTIAFKFHADGKEIILRYGEALVNRTDPRQRNLKIPHQYRLVGCVEDQQESGLYHFIFDVHCDGKQYDRLSWRQDTRQPDRKFYDATENRPFTPSSGDKGSVLPVEGEDMFSQLSQAQIDKLIKDGLTSNTTETGDPEKGTEPAPVNGRKTDPDPARTSRKTEETISEPVEPNGEKIWTVDRGTGNSSMTDEGARYLKENWKDLTKEVKLTPYRNSRTKQIEGVRVRKINEGSAARQFGIREQDVIIAINGQKVTSQKQAIAIIKREVNQRKKTKIAVKIRRAGREFTKNYDTRDPEARKAARDYARGRR